MHLIVDNTAELLFIGSLVNELMLSEVIVSNLFGHTSV